VHDTGNATFVEDLKAEGGDTDEIWIFQRLDERRMLSLWGSLRGNAAANAQKKPDEISFRTTDMVLAAGRGHDVEPISAAPFSRRAKGAVLLAGVASSGSALRARAEYYQKTEHW
jgi:hypothetical protein